MGRFRTPTRGFRVSFSALGAATAAVLLASTGVAADDSYSADDPTQPDPGLNLSTATTSFGGAAPLATSTTIRHWSGMTANQADGVTYRYNIVGVEPSTGGSAVVGVDVIPLDLTVGGETFSGSSAADGVLASPLFQTGDYSSTAHFTTSTGGRSKTGGPLSAGNAGVQYLDATMRSEFNMAGTDYHLVLDPTVLAPATIDASDYGTTLTSPGHVTYALVDQKWFSTRIQNELMRRHLDPTRLHLFLTYDVVLFSNGDMATCCILGAHGAGPATSPNSNGPAHGNGNQEVQTFVWGSWLTAGFFSPKTQWAKADVYSLSHEIAEWANDPFTDNTVEPWFSAKNPQYGCSNVFETGDPVLNLGFAMGTNASDQNMYSDHQYHLSDEAMLPWFYRSAPATQSSQSGDLRYTFLGDLNPFAIFHEPAAAC